MKMMQLPPIPRKKMNSSLAVLAQRSARASALALSLTLAFGAVSVTAVPLVAQQRGPVHRAIDGRVHDKNDAPLRGAVVYLKDSRTLAVKSFISDDEGAFHFGQLSQNTDYEVYAEFEGKRSKSKNVSSFDSKNDFNFTLKIL